MPVTFFTIIVIVIFVTPLHYSFSHRTNRETEQIERQNSRWDYGQEGGIQALGEDLF